jgi:hypothetical protein
MVKRNYEVVFVPNSTTNFSKLVDFSILLSPSLQMVCNLITRPLNPKKFTQSLSTSIQMNFLKSLDVLVPSNTTLARNESMK